mmetsp:Transcript_20647/g.58950  ORF Transcript_20647/g.58950 Transcript_20647/m.58950 type:complete len:282 (-) Transcript_20647:89-934(-)
MPGTNLASLLLPPAWSQCLCVVRLISSVTPSRSAASSTFSGSAGSTQKAFCVDPAEPEKVLDAAERLGVTLEMSLTTHKHWDHAGGNNKLAKLVPGIPIVGGEKEHVPACSKFVKDGEEFYFETIKIRTLLTPCHTSGHVLYYVTDPSCADPALFSGDTLFVAGCGRFFEGTGKDMYRALVQVCGSLPPNTRVFCGHEYTVKSLQFALSVEPNNAALKQKMTWAQQRRHENLPTVPSTIAEELSYNPFMRVTQPSVALATGVSQSDPVAVMTKLRQMKDVF